MNIMVDYLLANTSKNKTEQTKKWQNIIKQSWLELIFGKETQQRKKTTAFQSSHFKDFQAKKDANN